MSTFNEDIGRVYAEALDRLSRMLHAPGIPHAERMRIHTALRRLHRAYAHTGITSLAERAVTLNALAESLHSVLGRPLAATPLDALVLRQAVEDARLLLLRAAREEFPDTAAALLDDPDRIADDAEVPAALPSASANEQHSPRPSSLAPADKRMEYETMFAQCVLRPDKLATVNWYAANVCKHRERYAAVGGALNVPWWFIGAVHALESGFSFSGHLHNGDPLTARTRRVPSGRPLQGEPPFSWEVSAADALRYQTLDRWDDWSVSGALFQWEAYNGFGYRKHRVPSPYLWSFSNHYTQGRYVRDHVFDADAVSNQCGAATLLRALVNQGVVGMTRANVN
ncbi:MAG: hypothetical protein SGI88_02135 [Candidatus Hydrogenedentes bacterium]|nr:hypothetical protein [Candidatus Hydrogenedentota bacterium]